MTANDVLARLRRIRDRTAGAPIEPTLLSLAVVAHELRTSPVLAAAVSKGDGSVAEWIVRRGDPPDDLIVWGADAAHFLFLASADGRDPQRLRHRLREHLLEHFPQVFQSNERTATTDLVVHTFMDPIIEWAEVMLGTIPAFSDAVRRWAIRVEAFGIAGLPTRADALEGASVPDEHAFQLDLARFLYDQGFDLGRLGREQVLRERTGQGARIDFLLRDQREVAVELMVVRPGASLTSVNHHVTELRDYCRTSGAAHGMLVVVNLDPKRRLDIRPAEATAPSGVQTGGVHLLVSVVEAMRANASAEEKRSMCWWTSPPHWRSLRTGHTDRFEAVFTSWVQAAP